MNKRILKCLFVVFNIVFSLTVVHAETFSFNNLGDEVVVMDSTMYNDIACDSSKLNYFSMSSDANGNIKVKYSKIPPVGTSGTEEMTCTYSSKKVSMGAPVAGESKFTFSYSAPQNLQLTGSFTLDLFRPSYRVNFPDLSQILNVNYDSNMVDTDCVVGGTKNCSFSKKNEINEGNTTATVVYKTNSGVNITSILSITINRGSVIRVYPGGYGTCDFTSDWYSGTTDVSYSSYYTFDGDSAILPNCNADNSAYPLIEFVGWVGVNSTGFNVTAQVVDTCTTKNVFTAGTKVSQTSTGFRYFYACYKTSAGLVLYPNGAAISSLRGNGWVQKGAAYYKSANGANTIVLPIVTDDDIPSTLGPNARFLGWVKNGTSIPVAGGTAVDADGSSYVASFESSQITSQTGGDKKTVSVGETVYYRRNDRDILTCYAESNEFLEAFSSGGECMIRGIKSSNNNYVSVVASTGSEQFTIQVRVSSKAGITEGGDSGFIIDTSTNIIFAGGLNNIGTYSESYSTNDAMSQMCGAYDISIVSPDEDFTGEGIHISSYKATSTCGDNTSFAALCLDPSKAGPTTKDSNSYKIANAINPESLLGRVTSYIGKEIIDKEVNNNDFISSTSNEWRYAANIAIRVIDIYETGGSVSDKDVVVDHFAAYAEMAKLNFDNDNYKITLGRAIGNVSIQNKVESIITNALCGATIDGVKADWGNKCVSFVTTEEDDDRLEKTITSTDVIWSDDLQSYTLKYSGYVVFPKSVTGNVNFKEQCNSSGRNITCAGYFTEAGRTESGRLKYNFNVEIRASVNSKFPMTDADRKDVSFLITADGLNLLNDAYILKPFNGSNKQRLVILNTANSGVYLFFSSTPACNTAVPALDYTKCISEENCPGFNAELFKQAGCCELILDETSYAYKKACTNTCVYSYLPAVCEYKPGVTNNSDYSIYEGEEPDGTGKKYSQCIVNVENNKRVTAQNDLPGGLNSSYSDASGNQIQISEFIDNPFCNISCKEDWDFSLSSFGNYTGQNAVAAGSFFSMHNPIVVTGSRTCFTTYIDYEAVISSMSEDSVKVINSYNEYVRLTALRGSFMSYKSEAGELKVMSDFKLTTTKDEYCKKVGSKEITTGYQKKMDENGLLVDDLTKPIKETRYYCEEKDYCNNFKIVTSQIEYDTYSPNSGGTAKLIPGNKINSITIDTVNGVSGAIPSFSGAGSIDFGKSTFNAGNISATNARTPDGIEGYCPTSSNATGTFVNVLDNKELFFDAAFNALYPGIDDAILVESSNMVSFVNMIKDNAEDLYNCQHFQLYNQADDTNSLKVQNAILKGSYLSRTKEGNEWEREYFAINSSFNPQISYTYEEKEYMSLIGSNNLLVEDDYRNDYAACANGSDNCFNESQSITKDTVSLNNTNLTCYPYTYNISVIDPITNKETIKPITTNLCHNYVEAHYYDVDNKWSNGSIEGNNYHEEGAEVHYGEVNANGSLNAQHAITFCTINTGSVIAVGKDTSFVVVPADDALFHGGQCYVVYVNYFKANYIKQTIKDGSTYVNKGKWFVKEGTDVKSFSFDGKKETAIKINGDSVSNSGFWSLLGERNVFPIKMTTRRNLYQYVYTFGSIGSYGNGSLGRIMGTETSVLKMNNRSCFYEVYESICKCCGDPIDSEAFMLSGTSTSDYIKNNKVSFNESNYDVISSKSTLGFFDSTISLNDLNSDSDRDLADNWKVNDYYVNGNKHSTSKGGELAIDIQNVGENAYNFEPEYSFTLTPNALTEIRSYNEDNGYEVNVNNITAYGVYSITPINNCIDNANTCDWGNPKDENFLRSNEYVTFVHYGSKFLEGKVGSKSINMKDYWNDNNLLKSDKACLIVGSDYAKIVQASSGSKSVLYDMVRSGCRWIDYIDTDIDASTGATQHYRLAFK